MTKDFEARISALKSQYKELTVLTPEEQNARKLELKRNSPLTYRRCQRAKHDLLRLEAKRTQFQIDGNREQLSEVEDKILEKKKHWLDMIYGQKNK